MWADALHGSTRFGASPSVREPDASLRPARASSLSRTRLITLTVTSSTSNMDTSSPGFINDEVIADSEGEMDEEDNPGNRGTLIKFIVY